MTISHGNSRVRLLIATLLLLPLALVDVAAALAQAPPAGSLGVADPAAPLALTPAERTAIRNAVRQDQARPSAKMPANAPMSVGVQLPASTALRILPDNALAQAPAAKTLQYTMIEDQVVLVDPTNMRVVDIINQ
jgi:hypothetical protein